MTTFAYTRIYLMISIFFTLFLFYIDEGYYNFRWMLDWGNWIIFTVYASVVTGTLILADHLVFKRFTIVWLRVLLSCVTGTVSGVLLVIALLAGIRYWH